MTPSDWVYVTIPRLWVLSSLCSVKDRFLQPGAFEKGHEPILIATNKTPITCDQEFSWQMLATTIYNNSRKQSFGIASNSIGTSWKAQQCKTSSSLSLKRIALPVHNATNAADAHQIRQNDVHIFSPWMPAKRGMGPVVWSPFLFFLPLWLSNENRLKTSDPSPSNCLPRSKVEV